MPLTEQETQRLKMSHVIERMEKVSEIEYSKVGFLSGIISYLSMRYQVSDIEWEKALEAGRFGSEQCQVFDEQKKKMERKQ